MTTDTTTLAEAVADEGWPGAQGSAACCALLQALYRAMPAGLSRQDLQSFTGLDDDTFAAALTGLRQRRRVECSHPGRHGIYRIALPAAHLPPANRAAL